MIDASLKQLIETTYRDQINGGDYPPELKTFLLTHERKLKFFDNLMREFSHPKIKKALTKDQIITTVRSVTDVFVLAAKRRADELNMSRIERMRLTDAEQAKKDMKRLSDAMDNAEKTNVTQDKAGNETTQTSLVYNERFV